MTEMANPMLAPRIVKMTVNIGVGEGGKRLQTAENVLEMLTGGRPVRTLGRIQNRDLKVRKGAPIGCKVTIRDSDKISTFLKDAFWVRENTIPSWCFDAQGNLSFGISDYTEFPDQKYDPDIGIIGMDISVVLERPGHASQGVDGANRRSMRTIGSHPMNPELGSPSDSNSTSWRSETWQGITESASDGRSDVAVAGGVAG